MTVTRFAVCALLCLLTLYCLRIVTGDWILSTMTSYPSIIIERLRNLRVPTDSRAAQTITCISESKYTRKCRNSIKLIFHNCAVQTIVRSWYFKSDFRNFTCATYAGYSQLSVWLSNTSHSLERISVVTTCLKKWFENHVDRCIFQYSIVHRLLITGREASH